MPALRVRPLSTQRPSFTWRGMLFVIGLAAASHIGGCSVEEINGPSSTGGSGGTNISGVAGAGGGASSDVNLSVASKPDAGSDATAR
jgi:hypothetical protein